MSRVVVEIPRNRRHDELPTDTEAAATKLAMELDDLAAADGGKAAKHAGMAMGVGMDEPTLLERAQYYAVRLARATPVVNFLFFAFFDGAPTINDIDKLLNTLALVSALLFTLAGAMPAVVTWDELNLADGLHYNGLSNYTVPESAVAIGDIPSDGVFVGMYGCFKGSDAFCAAVADNGDRNQFCGGGVNGPIFAKFLRNVGWSVASLGMVLMCSITCLISLNSLSRESELSSVAAALTHKVVERWWTLVMYISAACAVVLIIGVVYFFLALHELYFLKFPAYWKQEMCRDAGWTIATDPAAIPDDHPYKDVDHLKLYTGGHWIEYDGHQTLARFMSLTMFGNRDAEPEFYSLIPMMMFAIPAQMLAVIVCGYATLWAERYREQQIEKKAGGANGGSGSGGGGGGGGGSSAQERVWEDSSEVHTWEQFLDVLGLGDDDDGASSGHGNASGNGHGYGASSGPRAVRRHEALDNARVRLDEIIHLSDAAAMSLLASLNIFLHGEILSICVALKSIADGQKMLTRANITHPSRRRARAKSTHKGKGGATSRRNKSPATAGAGMPDAYLSVAVPNGAVPATGNGDGNGNSDNAGAGARQDRATAWNMAEAALSSDGQALDANTARSTSFTTSSAEVRERAAGSNASVYSLASATGVAE